MDEVQETLEATPSVTPSLTPAVEPFENARHGPLVEAIQRPGVPPYPIVVVVPLETYIQPLKEHPPRQMPVGLYPFLDTTTGRLQLPTRRPSLDAWHPLSVFVPVEFKAQKGEPAFPARMKATEAHEPSLLRSHLQVEFPQPLR
jgi:hypothetical protein